MIESPVKATTHARKAEVQALVCVVPCGAGRALVALKLEAAQGGPTGEYFIPLTVEAENASPRAVAYGGLTTAIDKLRALHVDRVLIVVDDELLVEELERRVEPPKELFLQYVILGCKLNEFRRAKVVAMHSTRLEQLRMRAETLAATVYSTTPLLAHAM
jgi:hypothetical protein